MYESHPELLRVVVAERHESLRRSAYLARLAREARAAAPRRQRRSLRHRAVERRPHLVAPPPALAE